jgi:hypothetical protein
MTRNVFPMMKNSTKQTQGGVSFGPAFFVGRVKMLSYLPNEKPLLKRG